MDSLDVSGSPLYIRNSDLRSNGERFTKLDLCEIFDYHTPGYIVSVQPIGGIWKIWCKSDAAREYLLKKVITIKYNNRKIELYDTNPFHSPQTPSEKIILKDLPLDMSNDDILDFFEKNYPHIIVRSNVIMSRVPSRSNNLTHFYSGDRMIYARQGFLPALPKQVQIQGEPCKIWHKYQQMLCTRCGSAEHRDIDFVKCDSYEKKTNSDTFRDDTHPCSNFYQSATKLSVFDQEWTTAEHPYQWLKMKENGFDTLAAEIVTALTAREAKKIASKIPSYDLHNWNDEKKIAAMDKILRAKYKGCEEFRHYIFNSGDKLFVEGTMDLFWGAGMPLQSASQANPNKLIGKNQLGKLISKLRDEFRSNASKKTPESTSATSVHPEGSTQTRVDETTEPSGSTTIQAVPSETPESHGTTSLTQNSARDLPTDTCDPPSTGATSGSASPPFLQVHSSSTTSGNTSSFARVMRIIENDIELFPKHLNHDVLSGNEMRKSRSLIRGQTARSSSASCRPDRRDMRQIDDFFATVKRKASDSAISPTSESATKMTKTDNDDDSSPSLAVAAIGGADSDVIFGGHGS